MTEIFSATIEAPVEKVWATLTEGEQIARWFSGGGECTIDELAPGGTMTLGLAGGGTVRGHIVEVEPQRVFAYRIVNEIGGDGTGEPEYVHIRFMLTADGDRTRLRLEEENSHLDKIKAVAEAL
ncbi:SRPBCC domain-containing protein [Spirillospora sp. NBC_00431]